MQRLFFFLSIITFGFSVLGQEEKIEIVPVVEISMKWPKSNKPATFFYSVKGIPILKESLELNNHNDLYTYLSKIPGVSISSNNNLTIVPTIRMRGDDDTIVFVDGIRYDTSILNSLNPINIESIIVAPNVTASS